MMMATIASTRRRTRKRRGLDIGIQFLLLGAFFSIGARAWAPPLHPETFETVHQMRRRLGIHYNYTSTTIHPEMCRYLTEEECQDSDVSMKEHIASQKALQKKLRSLQKRQGQAQNSPRIGNIKVRCVRFVDRKTRQSL